jgi:hypothetical protein
MKRPIAADSHSVLFLRYSIRVVFGLAAFAALATGCSGDDAPETLAMADDAPLVSQPDASFSDAENVIIQFHVDWLCEVERRTFVNLDDADVALADALAANDIDPDVYDQFVDETLTTQSGRDAVRYAYQETCRSV